MEILLLFSNSRGPAGPRLSRWSSGGGHGSRFKEASAARWSSEFGNWNVSTSRVVSRRDAGPSPEGVCASDAGLEGSWTFDFKVSLERHCGRRTKPLRRRWKWCWAGRDHELFVNTNSNLREISLTTVDLIYKATSATSGDFRRLWECRNSGVLPQGDRSPDQLN